jgi:uncharacterized paraquat-inducible protein A
VTAVPWCEHCNRFFNPPSMGEGGECPACGRVIATAEDLRTPWHFKLLVVATALYLGFRAYQGVVWLVERV